MMSTFVFKLKVGIHTCLVWNLTLWFVYVYPNFVHAMYLVEQRVPLRQLIRLYVYSETNTQIHYFHQYVTSTEQQILFVVVDLIV